MSWQLRRIKYMTHAQLAAEAGLTRQHVSDYLNHDDKPTRRSLPAEAASRWNCAVGNTLTSQWLAWQDRLTVLEEMQATRAVA
jgi:transcriptional regulator with XRE-family HTH domain